jgi:glucosamine kinase
MLREVTYVASGTAVPDAPGAGSGPAMAPPVPERMSFPGQRNTRLTTPGAQGFRLTAVPDEDRVTPPSASEGSVQAGLRLVGLDIGGTRSRARLWAGGQTAAETESASASLPAVGVEDARAALLTALGGLGLDPAQPVDAICVGSAGLSVPGADSFLRAQLAPFARAGRVVVVTDAMLVLPAAGLGAGVAVICGTGSVAVGVDGERSVQAGGWGYLLGDEGGGYWIVREAVRLLLSRRERGCSLGDLADQLLAATGSADLAALQRTYYAQPHLPREWARYARTVLESADPAAAEIASRGAAAVAALAATAGELAAPRPRRLPVVLAGGLMSNARYRQAVERAVSAILPSAEVRVLDDEPVAGAIRLAALAAGARA